MLGSPNSRMGPQNHNKMVEVDSYWENKCHMQPICTFKMSIDSSFSELSSAICKAKILILLHRDRCQRSPWRWWSVILTNYGLYHAIHGAMSVLEAKRETVVSNFKGL